MAKTLSTYPDAFLFIADGIKYTIEDANDTAPLKLTFRIQYANATFQWITEDLYELVYPEVTISNGVQFSKWKVDLSDIIQAYASKLRDSLSYIYGYVKIQLVEINDTETELDPNEHICLLGTSGGLYLSKAQPVDSHPFLLARGNEDGALHFYRSELKAMGIFFAIKPDVYNDITFNVDNPPPGTLIPWQTFYKRTIEGYNELLGIFYDSLPDVIHYHPYQIISASTIIIQLTGESGVEDRMYAIAVQNDPETDETYLIRWTNSMGAPEALLLSGELQDISELEKPDIYISNQSVLSTARKTLRGTVTTKYSLQTGYLTPARIIALKDMLMSEEVEIQIDGRWIPVSVSSDIKHAVHQREPENFELTIEVLEQTRYHKPNRTVRPLPATRAALLQDNSGNIIVDNNSNTIY